MLLLFDRAAVSGVLCGRGGGFLQLNRGSCEEKMSRLYGFVRGQIRIDLKIWRCRRGGA
jgi:hypothetical protein